MKKVMILTAAVMAFSFTTPQVAKALKIQNQIAVVDDKDDKYKEIKVEELPEVVTKSISNAYTGYKIDKAFKAEDDSYKVNVAMGDLKYQLFYDAKGELIKVEDPTSKDANDQLLNKTGVEPESKSVDPANKGLENKGMEPSNKSQTPPINKSENNTNESETDPLK